jgi:hypothetical protein
VKRSWREVAARVVPESLRRRAGATTDRPAPLDGATRVLEYNPELDGRADPGEVVWTWVAYEDDPRRGKDRPVVVVGHRGATLLGLMLSSNADRQGQRDWYALGAGAWDREAWPSWVRLDRVLEVEEDGIRREGTVLDRRRFDAMAQRLRTGYGWR